MSTSEISVKAPGIVAAGRKRSIRGTRFGSSFLPRALFVAVPSPEASRASVFLVLTAVASTLLAGTLLTTSIVGTARAQFIEPTDLLFSWDGEADNDQFGFVNRLFGDIDSDGTVDMGVGVPRHDGAGEDSGKVYIFSGRTGLLLRTHEGFAANQYFGYEIANVGDVTNDGVPDYLIARPRSINFSQYFGPGEAILYSGATGDSLRAWSTAQLGLGAGAQVAGAGNFDTRGVGDVNADGTPDFLITALIASGSNGLAGKVY
ncbi:MAG: integrin alpha, partial [Candidatus Eisenbacteria bacterium]